MPDAHLPRSLVLFAADTPPAVRRRRLALVAVVVVAVVALNWPVYPLYGGAFPLVLGLPASMAWVVLWLVLVFFVLVWTYRHDLRRSAPAREEPPGSEGAA